LSGFLVSCPLLASWQVFSQYREHGVLLWRGFSFDDFANQVSSCEIKLLLLHMLLR
jgi:TPP-dependent pyruvate/acetoin dehydrogenase alpha subunit